MVVKATRKKKKKKRLANTKAGSGERAACRHITTFITGMPQPEVVWRSATSGGKATRSKIADHTMAGDIVAIHHSAFPFTARTVCEVKNRKKGDPREFLVWDDEQLDCCYKNKKGNLKWKQSLVCWWKKVGMEADNAGRLPLLLVKRFGSARWHLYMRADDMNKLRAHKPGHYPYPVVLFSNMSVESVSMVDLEQFISHFNLDDFVRAFPNVGGSRPYGGGGQIRARRVRKASGRLL